MKLTEIAKAIEEIVPLKLAQPWDNVGFLLGNPNRPIRTILLTIDTTFAVAAEAESTGADLILSYHPVICDGLKSITSEGPTAVIWRLIRSDIGVFSIHTALDTVLGGVNDALADLLDIQDPKPLGDFVADPRGPQYKVVTFVPVESVQTVAEALYEAGAGAIGHYSHCGFQVAGTGTFKPLHGAHPSIGKKGKLEKVQEVRLETVVSSEKVQRVVAALRRTHPYETPAFDVVRHYDVENRLGLGRYGKLRKPLSIPQVLQRVRRATGTKTVGIVGPQKRQIRTAAVCAGSCGKILNTVIDERCDLYLTGELKHHQALAAAEAGLTCLCLSHSNSERFALKILAQKLKKHLPNVTIRLSKKDKDPFVWKPI